VRAIVVIVEIQLFLTVRRVIRRIQVEYYADHPLRLMWCEAEAGEHHRGPEEFLAGDAVLPAREGGLTPQRATALRGVPDGAFEERIRAERVRIVGIFITAGDLQDALPEQCDEGQLDLRRIPRVLQGRR